MRRSRFATAVPSDEPTTRVTFAESLLFDVSTPATAELSQLSTWRAATLLLIPLFMLATHALLGGLSLALEPALLRIDGLNSPPLLLGAILLLDAVAAFATRAKAHFDVSPQTFVRALTGYIAASSLLIILFGGAAAAGGSHHGDHSAALMVFGSLAALAAACSFSPPLTVAVAIAGVIAGVAFYTDPLVLAGIIAMAVLVPAYSVFNACGVIAFGRRRSQVEGLARKAKSFVEEFESSGRGWFWETRADGTLSYVSEALAEDFHCAPPELLGRRFTDLLSVDKASEAGLEERKTLGFHLSARFPFSDVIVCPASEEDIHWSLSGNPIFDATGRFLGFRGIGTDLTEQLRSEQEINRLAKFDSLTGLPNRAMMRMTLDEALRNSTYRRKGCALFLIDLDRFKAVNDTLGHPVGDALLRQVAERLKSVMGNHGKIGRLGGDEFQAVLPGVSDVGLLESLARTLIEQVSRPYMIEGNKVSIGASVGIDIGDPGKSNADALVRNADLALYAAKAAGRGKHKLFEASMHSEAAERQLLENDLGKAIERNELFVVYQPIVHTAGEEISGFEALLRWKHPTRGLVSPEKFIPLAEETGLIRSIGTWVLNQALAEARKWPERIRIAVNLSPVQFNDPAVVATIAKALADSGVKPSRLELELTEGVFLADNDSTDDTFAKLKALGVRLALDDFGTGYSSLGYLKKAPFDKIKIDQSFVRGAASGANRNGAIIRAIVTLAETLGMDSCAEGVETHDDLQLIRELGVSMVQGYIFGKPESGEVALTLTQNETVEADGFQCVREARHRLMRRAITQIGGEQVEVRLSNISSMGAQVECGLSVSPGTELTIDIVGVGPVRGVVRWAQAGKFGLQFGQEFNLARLAPKRDLTTTEIAAFRPWYLQDGTKG